MNNKNVQLYAWIETGKNEEVKNLIKELGVDYVAEGGAALNYAALYNNLEIVRFCIENGADVNHGYESTKESGYTPLMAACWKGNLEIVKLLIENGADINAIDKYGRSAIDILVFQITDNEEEILRLLLQAGVNPKKISKNYRKSPYDFLKEVGGTHMMQIIDTFSQ